ncbi:DUF4411 family protein [Staphylococcus petrasii]|uniref:DUF4411 family protein n=2 Tax=Staphylococcus petrasii TaxID=1276936 RepID=UPI000CD2C7B0|nr:DUF4411 family protein [Staphylococcus petrasii]PNZ81238.1 hypothetical protein CD127_08480 [Staphylococcus petrasii]TGA80331.1 DUF4411 family protein [Staphylococcus petrasii]SUM59426.1 Uncharacterised protein [Staphylococcus petrasii]
MSGYLMDANSFISPANKYYKHSVFPSYWAWLESHIGQQIYITREIFNELTAQSDELKDWITQIPSPNCVNPSRDQKTVTEYGKVMQFLNTSRYYTDVSVNLWAAGSKADPWIIAYAVAHDLIVVTEEKSNLNGIINSGNPTKKEPKIPDVCEAMNIPCITLDEMLLQMKLVL